MAAPARHDPVRIARPLESKQVIFPSFVMSVHFSNPRKPRISAISDPA